MIEPPLDFDATTYRSLHPDLAHLDDQLIQAHYERHGKAEGRRAHTLASRVEFAQLLSGERTLEIGPFALPLIRGPQVRYADIYSTTHLQEIAPAHGFNPLGVPEIDWVVEPGDLSSINETFDAVISSHAIEHQPNFVGHLRQVSDLLRAEGRYFILAPDHRYCFDHFKPTSTIVDVLDAYVRNVRLHDPKTVILNRYKMTHNDAARHWDGDHGDADLNPHFPSADRPTLLRDALTFLQTAPGAIYDNHAWCLTPDTFAAIISDLGQLELIDFHLERLFPTMRNTLEFWAILRKN